MLAGTITGKLRWIAVCTIQMTFLLAPCVVVVEVEKESVLNGMGRLQIKKVMIVLATAILLATKNVEIMMTMTSKQVQCVAVAEAVEVKKM